MKFQKKKKKTFGVYLFLFKWRGDKSRYGQEVWGSPDKANPLKPLLG